MSPSPLVNLRTELNRLVRMRAAVRFASSVCAWAAGTIGVVSLLFLVDRTFHLSIEMRRVIVLLGLAGFAFAVKQILSVIFSNRETIEDVVLIVEKQHGIDSDLIAALQFERTALRSGSESQLTQAVIADVVERTRPLNVFDGFSLGALPARAYALAVVTVIFIAIVTYESDSTSTFVSRFLLGNATYPTRTLINSIQVNGQTVWTVSEPANPQIRVPFGDPVKFEIEYSGQRPRMAFARLTTSQNSRSEKFDLKPSSSNRASVTGELGRMTESFRSTFSVGDAISRPIDVDVIPLPMVDMQWEIVPPKYAQRSAVVRGDSKNSNQLSVLSGSAARLRLIGINKELKAAQATVAGSTIELTAAQQDSSVSWILPPSNPFETINESFAYEIQVIDQDGLSLARPITGSIQIKADGSPRITASAVTQYVLPTAEPKLDYVATDDFGVSQIDAAIEILHQDGRPASFELSVKTVPETDQPLVEVRGQISIPLSRYELSKGDSVRVTPRVTDWRGEQPGHRSTGESVTFLVTDLAGILSQVAEEDKKAAKLLEEIIKAAGAKPQFD